MNLLGQLVAAGPWLLDLRWLGVIGLVALAVVPLLAAADTSPGWRERAACAFIGALLLAAAWGVAP